MNLLLRTFPRLLLIFSIVAFSKPARSQQIIGTWQLIKQTSCIEDELGVDENDQEMQDLYDEMKASGGPSAQIVTFKEKGVAEQSSRILNKKKTANNNRFLYRFTGENLLVLDKKSQTLIDNFMVDKFSPDSLILSNARRPCETKIFLKIKDGKAKL